MGFVKDWRVDVSVAERNMTKMVRNREWDHLHAEDTSTDIQKLTILLIIIPTCCSQEYHYLLSTV